MILPQESLYQMWMESHTNYDRRHLKMLKNGILGFRDL